MKRLLPLIALFALPCAAINPIVPPGTYYADGEAHVWDDGKMYIYPSRDESPDYYCSWRYDVLVSDNLRDWNIVENSFVAKGPGDVVDYSDAPLYAPDEAFKDGKYYLYYCMPAELCEGVAVSDSPTGPFTQATPIPNAKQIDPAVFVDDDGQAYYYWGQFTAKGAKLQDDMRTLVPGSEVELIDEKNEYFHEGSCMRKRNGIYYLVYAHLRKGRPTCIGYSTSKSPLGPFEYGGVIIDNAGSDPMAWNNHESIEEFNGQWYVVYHRPTHGAFSMRKVCMEPIHFNEDGSIDEVEMTSQGAGEPLDACKNIEAEYACYLWGDTRITRCGEANEHLSHISDGDYAKYRYLDFGRGVKRFQATVTPKRGGKIIVKIGNYWEPTVGEIIVPPSTDGKPVVLTADIENVKGVQELHLVFRANDAADSHRNHRPILRR